MKGREKGLVGTQDVGPCSVLTFIGHKLPSSFQGAEAEAEDTNYRRLKRRSSVLDLTKPEITVCILVFDAFKIQNEL